VYNKGEVWIDDVYLAMEPNPRTPPAILNWIYLRSEDAGLLPFRTSAQIEKMEELLRSVPAENFWGIIFICEEVYKTDIRFNDDVNTTWFGETVLGYPLYLAENPGAKEDEWKDEMYLRMVRGFYNHFHPFTKVGITVGQDTIIEINRDSFFGEPASAFVQQYCDFVVLYVYTINLQFFYDWPGRVPTRTYISCCDELFPKQWKFWILTRIFDDWQEEWEREAIALEMKNCLDRNMVIVSYYWSEPPFAQQWADMLRCIELYATNQPYYEVLTYGENRLTGVVGYTYGYVGY
jgi:hypothetical protein